jgi:hypothetical protein
MWCDIGDLFICINVCGLGFLWGIQTIYVGGIVDILWLVLKYNKIDTIEWGSVEFN